MPLLSPNTASLQYGRITVLDHDQLGPIFLDYNPFGWTGTSTATANRARFIPIVVQQTCIAYRMFFHVSANASGNCDVGIYDESGTRLVSSGSVAVTINSNMVDIPDTTLTPGRYFLAFSLSSATVSLIVGSITTSLARSTGMGNASAALPLPASVTLAGSAAEGFIPVLGVDLRGF